MALFIFYFIFLFVGSSPQFSHALDKLTNVSVSSIQSPFLSSVVYSAAQRLEFGIRGEGNLSDKKLEGVLKVVNHGTVLGHFLKYPTKQGLIRNICWGREGRCIHEDSAKSAKRTL